MTASVSQIAAALCSAVSANVVVPGSKVKIRSLPYLGDTFTPPIVLAAVEGASYHEAAGIGNAAHTFTVSLILSRVSDRSAWSAVEAYMSAVGTSSVYLALEADPTLGGVVNNVYVDKAGPPRSLTLGTSGAIYLEIPFSVEVIA